MKPIVKVLMPDRDALMPALEDVLYSGMIAEGKKVYEFEAAFGKQFGLDTVLATSSGSAALHIAFILAGVEPGCEVITTSMTAEPTNTTILSSGATPVFADVDSTTGNLLVADVAKRISDKTKAICVVHYAGYPADLDGLRALADQHGLSLIEDCAHALGAKSQGRPIGTIGDFAIFSLQAIKHMTTVDGGVLVLKDSANVLQAKKIRWFGLQKGIPRTELDITIQGYKYNMTNVAAVIGLEQLKIVGAAIEKHCRNADRLNQLLADIPGVSPATVIDGDAPSYWLYTLLADDADDAILRLRSAGFDATKVHRPNHLHTIFAAKDANLPNLATFYDRLVHIPCGWWIDDQDLTEMCQSLK